MVAEQALSVLTTSNQLLREKVTGADRKYARQCALARETYASTQIEKHDVQHSDDHRVVVVVLAILALFVCAEGMVGVAQDEEVLPLLTYEVVRHRGHWRVLHIGRHSAPHLDQEAAKAAAIESARQARASGCQVTVRLLRTDGEAIELDPDCSD